jgi:hypothetical protein
MYFPRNLESSPTLSKLRNFGGVNPKTPPKRYANGVGGTTFFRKFSMAVGCIKPKDNNHNHFLYRDTVPVPITLHEAVNILYRRKTTTLVTYKWSNKEHIQVDQKASVHRMITTQKYTTDFQSVRRQFPDIYWHKNHTNAICYT